jgi:hypothetical protein
VRSLAIARVTTAGIGALMLVILMVLGAAGWLPGTEQEPVPSRRSTLIGEQLPAALDDAPRSVEAPLPPNASPRPSLTGDEVSPALATYGIDRDGNLFEIHSPQTEEPRLRSPIG